MFTLNGVAGFLFVPMARAVVFAMIASFVLSRTLVPTMAMYLLKPHVHAGATADQADEDSHLATGRNPLLRLPTRVRAPIRAVPRSLSQPLGDGARPSAHLRHRIFGRGCCVFRFGAVPRVEFLSLGGFRPDHDLHVRPPVGTRIEDASAAFGDIEQTIRSTIPPRELSSIVDNIGLPTSSINMIYNNSGLIGYQDGDIYISLNANHHATAGYVRICGKSCRAAFPGMTFSFLPADIVSQILNFGSPAPLDVQITGPNGQANQAYALAFLRRLRLISGVADARMQQSLDNPELRVDVDRSRIAELGLAERDVTNSVVTSLAGSSQTAPTFWLDPKSGVSYAIAAQMPEYDVDSLAGLANIPVTGATASGAPTPLQVLGGLGKIWRDDSSAVVTHYNVRPSIDLYATTQGRDLGGVAAEVRRVIASTAHDVPKGATVVLARPGGDHGYSLFQPLFRDSGGASC